MCPIATSLALGDVTKGELVEPVSAACRLDGVDGKEDNPGEEPDGHEDANHHAEVLDEHVRVEAVVVLDRFPVGAPYSEWPAIERLG